MATILAPTLTAPNPLRMNSMARIPQSSAPPLDAFGEHPWDIAQRRQDEARGKWFSENRKIADEAYLDPEKAFPDVEQGFAPDLDTVRRQAANDDLMRLYLDGQDPPTNETERYLMRMKIAHHEFNGEGAESEDTFFQAAKSAADGRVAYNETMREIHRQAVTDAMTSAPTMKDGTITRGNLTWAQVRAEMQGKPGYDPAREAEMMAFFYDSRAEAKQKLAAYKTPLDMLFGAMQATAEPGVMNRIAGPDIRARRAYETLSSIPREKQDEFLEALALRAQTLSQEERAGFFDNFLKSLRGINQFRQGAVEEFLAQATDMSRMNPAGQVGIAPPLTRDESRQARQDFQLDREFVRKVQEIHDGIYDPVQYLTDEGSIGRIFEEIGYQVVPVTVNSLTMALPYVGLPAMFGGMKGASHNNLMARFTAAGIGTEQALDAAEFWSVPMAITETALEKAQYGIWSRKLPGFSKWLDTLGDKIVNRGARFGMKTLVIGAAETGIEIAQETSNWLIQDLAAALDEDLPDVQWTGEGGAFDGFWANSAVIFGTMLPLAMLGASGGLSMESRNAAFRKASPLERTALGITPEASAAIDAATGPASLASAIDQAWETRDPNSPEAQAAVEQMKQRVEQARRASAMLEEGMGYSFPGITVLPDGTFVVRDNLTGEEVGRAGSAAELREVVNAHSVAMETMQEDEMLELGAWLASAKVAAKESGIEQELNLSRRFGMADVEAMGPAAMERFMAEVALQEQAEGGDGSAARAVFGYNITESRAGMAQTVNRIFKGANISTLFHENWHSARRKAKKAGTLTREDDIRFLRALDTVLQGKTREVRGEDQRVLVPATRKSFIPEGMQDADISEELLDEAIAEVADVLTFLFPRGHKTNKHGLTRKIVSTYLGAVGRLAPEATRKFSAFIRAIRAKMGLAMSRAYHLKKGIAAGTIDPKDIDAYVNKLMGTDAQQEHDDGVRAELNRILAMEDNVADDDIPFSIGRAEAVRLENALKKPTAGVSKTKTLQLADQAIEYAELMGMKASLVSSSRDGSQYLEIGPRKYWDSKWGWSEFVDEGGELYTMRIANHERQLSGIINHKKPKWDTVVNGSAYDGLQKAALSFDYMGDWGETSPTRAAEAADMQSRETVPGSESRQSLGTNQAGTGTDASPFSIGRADGQAQGSGMHARPNFKDLSPEAVEQNAAAWSRAWNENTSIGNRAELGPFKNALISHLIDLSKTKKWVWGVGWDGSSRGFPWVVYFETPAGQISFHGSSITDVTGNHIDQNSVAKKVKSDLIEAFPMIDFKWKTLQGFGGWHVFEKPNPLLNYRGPDNRIPSLPAKLESIGVKGSYEKIREIIRKRKSEAYPEFEGKWDGVKGAQAERLNAVFGNDNAAMVSQGGVSGQESASPTRGLARGQGQNEAGTGPDASAFSIGRSTVTPTASTRAFQGAAGSPSVIGPAAFSIGAWHGTPHKWKPETKYRLPDGKEVWLVDNEETVPDGAVVIERAPAGRARADKVGTGEGAAAYGWGVLYAADLKENAEGYRNTLVAQKRTYPREVLDMLERAGFRNQLFAGNNSSAAEWLALYRGEPLEVLRNALKVPPKAQLDAFKEWTATRWEKAWDWYEDWEADVDISMTASASAPEVERTEVGLTEGEILAIWRAANETGNLYRVELDVEQDELLDWDKPLSEQSEKVRKALESLGFDVTGNDPGDSSIYDKYGVWEPKDLNGERAYFHFGQKYNSKEASETLAAAGIRGIRYLDGNSRGAMAPREATMNYVIFDESAIKITEENGTPVDLSREGGSFSIGRLRTKQAVKFTTPIQTPLGNVVGYEWQSKVIEADSGGVEGVVLKRVSDWDKAVTNAETGRDIVHHFIIEKPDGTQSTVSLESTLKQAGDKAKDIKQIITAAKRLPLREAELAQLTADLAEYSKLYDAEERRVSYLTPPEPSWKESDWEHVRSSGRAEMYVGDVFVSVEDQSKPFPRDRIDFGRGEWKRSQMQIGMEPPDSDRAEKLQRQVKKDKKTLKDAGVLQDSNEAPAFSIGRADVAERMQGGALSMVRDPIRRVQAMSRIARDFGELFLSFQRIEALAGRRRSKAQLRQEANAREDLAAEEKIGAIWAKFGGILADDDVIKLKAQPVFNHLSVPGRNGQPDPLRGRLMSFAQAIKRFPEQYALHRRGGNYDGAEGISRTVFGGQLSPDQAAQELYDEGLIKDPYPDTMWEALRQEQNSVISKKELYAAAMEQIREAKREAKREASEWLQTQGQEQETNYNPKEEILASLRMLDAILLALPPEIRGKIGGYTQMARINTDEARLAFLKDRLKKADKELETFLRESFNREWIDLLRRAKPDKDNPGERPTGVIDADALDILRTAEAAMWMSFAEGETEADRLDALADHEDTKPEDVEKLRATAQMVRLTANWSAADAARREQAVIEGTRIYFGGLSALRIKQSRRRERLDKLRLSAKNGTGKAGSRMERKKMQRKADGSRWGQATEMVWDFMSFGQVVNVIFGEKSAFAKWMNAREIAASNSYVDAVQAKAEALESMFESLSGSRFGGEKLRHRMQTVESITVEDALGKTHTFNDAEAIQMILEYRQEDGKRHYHGIIDDAGVLTSEWGWTEQQVDEIESQLSNEARAMLAFLGTSYGEEHGRINEVFRRIWNVSMPRHKLYAPLASLRPVMGKQDAIKDLVSGDSMGMGMTPGSLKNRSQTAIAEPTPKDAFQVYLNHARQMEHFIAYGEFARDAQAVVNRRDTRNSVEAISPNAATILNNWVEWMAQGGIKNTATVTPTNRFIGGALNRLTTAALVGRVSVLAMQALQLGAALYKMPTGAYLSRFARLTMGRLGWGDAVNSAYIQRRLKEMPPVVRDLVMGLAAGTPNRAKYFATRLGRSISGADALFTAGTYAIIYDYQLTQARKAGDPNPEQTATAEAERITDQVAQPVRTGARSWYEVANQSNPANRAMWNFASDPRQKMSLVVYEMMRRDVSGTEKTAAVAKAAAVTWMVSGILQAVLRAIFRDIRNGDDDEIFDERHWDLKRLALMSLTGPIGGFPMVGSIIEDATYKAAGIYMPNDNILSALANSTPAAIRLATLDSDNVLKDIENVLTGAATVSGTASAGASGMHVIRDAVNIYENFDNED